MLLKKNKRSAVLPSVLFLCFGVLPTLSVANFYTIIGPDGHPMIVQRSVEIPKKNIVQKEFAQAETPKKVVLSSTAQSPVSLINQQERLIQLEKANKHQKNNGEVTSFNQLQKQQPMIEETKKNEIKNEKAKNEKAKNEKAKSDITTQKKSLEPKVTSKQKITTEKLSTYPDANLTDKKLSSLPVLAVPINQNNPTASSNIPAVMTQQNVDKTEESKTIKTPFMLTQKATIQSQNTQMNDQLKNQNTDQNFTIIDGVKYVNNEYLEDKEFNLDGKKRFYIMPEVSAGMPTRLATVEREKGVSLSFIDKMIKNKPDKVESIALSSTYYRLPQPDIVKILEQTCFTGKRLEKAKILSLKNPDIGFWPVAPIKEKFAFEVVKLNEKIQDILLTSYASSNKTPTFYWPLIVFLDQKGCVIEGVSGFKNKDIVESNFQHAALEGILKKPLGSAYMLMTPLESAVDIENKQLTNHGQIKLSIIR